MISGWIKKPRRHHHPRREVIEGGWKINDAGYGRLFERTLLDMLFDAMPDQDACKIVEQYCVVWYPGKPLHHIQFLTPDSWRHVLVFPWTWQPPPSPSPSPSPSRSPRKRPREDEANDR
jgi:hypothetical protein